MMEEACVEVINDNKKLGLKLQVVVHDLVSFK